MDFKTLSISDKKYIKKIYHDSNITWTDKLSMLSKYSGKSSRTVQDWIKKLGYTHTDEPVDYKKAKERKFNKLKKRFIITWAQNDTPIHKPFLKNIETYAKFIDADIHIIAGRYKNATSIFSTKSDRWCNDIVKYLDANRHNIHKYVSIMSDVKIQPTAVNPMSSLEGMSGLNSCVFGSPKVQMDVISVLEGSKPKIMMTTGAITKMNYTDSKAGKKGEFHHTYGFVIIEIQDKDVFHIRQVTADKKTGDFNDLFYNVKEGVVTKNTEIEAIVLGDIHVGDTDDVVMNCTIDLLNKLKPKKTVVHDLFNGTSISHHDLNNPIKLYHKEISGSNSLKNEIDDMLKWIEQMKKFNLIVVRSNHDDFIDRWILNSDWKHNIKNTMEYIYFTKILLENKAPKGIIPYIINEKYPDVITLGRDESYIIKNWEVGVHGDMGKNGSRGSLLQFRSINTKIIVGHYHSPQRKDGAMAVGTSTKLRLDYNKGASNWLNSHVIIHTDGRTQHINFINGNYTTL